MAPFFVEHRGANYNAEGFCPSNTPRLRLLYLLSQIHGFTVALKREFDSRCLILLRPVADNQV